ncbi:hypothetical protein BT63DRAFT_460874 [Microthyrium microscopicum]|uniref:Uncharacterized protein n=1 Tax=Microthyrium microscopicum TaxID=703497 RepID=A0A6A6TYK5_9PEZI|nr:hypothetical protein BT63DRAFT_460874 [Microthyrium microscopicum]
MAAAVAAFAQRAQNLLFSAMLATFGGKSEPFPPTPGVLVSPTRTLSAVLPETVKVIATKTVLATVETGVASIEEVMPSVFPAWLAWVLAWLDFWLDLWSIPVTKFIVAIVFFGLVVALFDTGRLAFFPSVNFYAIITSAITNKVAAATPATTTYKFTKFNWVKVMNGKKEFARLAHEMLLLRELGWTGHPTQFKMSSRSCQQKLLRHQQQLFRQAVTIALMAKGESEAVAFQEAESQMRAVVRHRRSQAAARMREIEEECRVKWEG